jgi:hypothetical protein
MGVNAVSSSLISQVGTTSSSQDLLADARSKRIVSSVVSVLKAQKLGWADGGANIVHVDNKQNWSQYRAFGY